MKISAKAEYACLAVLALARQGPESSPLHIREISEAYGIPERYLVQILLQLKGAGLVASTRGAAGGYRLARAASSISLSEVLVAVDGPDASRRDSSATKRPTTSVLAVGLGKRPRRGTRRSRPHHDRSACRTVLAPRVDHLTPTEGPESTDDGLEIEKEASHYCHDINQQRRSPRPRRRPRD